MFFFVDAHYCASPVSTVLTAQFSLAIPAHHGTPEAGDPKAPQAHPPRRSPYRRSAYKDSYVPIALSAAEDVRQAHNDTDYMNAAQRALRIPNILSAVLENILPTRAPVWFQSFAKRYPGALKPNYLGGARFVCRQWAAEGMRLQWRSSSLTKLERVDPRARTKAATLIEGLDSDLHEASRVAGVCFPRL